MEFTREKVDSIQFWVLNVASFVAQLTIAMVNLAMVYHLRSFFHLGADKIGIAASISTSAYLLFCILLAPYTTHFKPRNLVETSLLGMAVSVGFFASTANLAIAYASLAFYGAFMSLLWPQIEGWFSRGKEGGPTEPRLQRLQLLLVQRGGGLFVCCRASGGAFHRLAVLRLHSVVPAGLRSYSKQQRPGAGHQGDEE